MQLSIINKELNNGPGYVAHEIIHFGITNFSLPVTIKFQHVLTGLRESKFFQVGRQNDPDRYGPFIKTKIAEHHFREIATGELFNDIRFFLESVNQENGTYITDIDFLVGRLELNTDYMPMGDTRFYYFMPSFSKRPMKGIEGITDECIIGFDYFLCIIGFNQTNVYLFSVCFD